VDNVIDIDFQFSRAVMSACHTDIPLLALLDFSAAFPSIARELLRAILEAAQIPAFIRWTILQLYKNADHGIIFNGCACPGFTISSGIKQGCSLSGALFALCMDSFIRCCYHFVPDSIQVRLFLTIPPFYSRMPKQTRGRSWPSSISSVVPAGSRPLWPRERLNHSQYVSHVQSGFSGFAIKFSAKYLGIMVGPDAWISPWELVLIPFKQGVAKLCKFGLGLHASICLYNLQSSQN
jgi:hypothetical protein